MPLFPGFDPFIESQLWEDFHTHYIVALRNQLVPQLRGRYLARVEARVYVEHPHAVQPVVFRPDVAVLSPSARQPASLSPRVPRKPVLLPIAMPEEVTEPYINILSRDKLEVISVIELLSPGNKQPGTEGRQEYLRKRDNVVRSAAHLVELDLLRGGERMPMAADLPAGDYYAVSSPASQRPLAAVWAWTVPEPMPVVTIPLVGQDEASLDLQEAFETLYQEADYEHQLDHSQALRPPATEALRRWLETVLAG